MILLRRWAILTGFALVISVSSVEAQSTDPLRFIQWTAADILSIPESTVSLESGLKIGIATGGVLLASHFDRRLSENAGSLSDSSPNRLRHVFHEAGNVQIIRPMAAILFIGALTGSDVYFQDAAFTSLQSVILANILTSSLKTVVGRARPDRGLGPGSIHPFDGNRSFPSGHATTIFALTTPWLLYYPGIPSGVLFALGIGTAVARVADEYHWFSDVVAGAIIGFGMGYYLSKRHQRLARGVTMGVSQYGVSFMWKI